MYGSEVFEHACVDVREHVCSHTVTTRWDSDRLNSTALAPSPIPKRDVLLQKQA